MGDKYETTAEAAQTGYWSGLHSAWMLFKLELKDGNYEELVDALGELEQAFRFAANEEVVKETVGAAERLLNGESAKDILREVLKDDPAGDELMNAIFGEDEIKLG